MYQIKTYDKIANAGRVIFGDNYRIADDVVDPDGILVHSTPLHDVKFGDNLKSVVRIGAGVNTIPVDSLTKKGVVVFNCPGGNANAVKELTISAMIMAMRNGFKAMHWVKNLPEGESEAGKIVEKGKEQFRGPEIKGKTLGIIGVGAIGSRMAKSCYDLGMKVIGYDPYLSNARMQELSQYVTFVFELDELLPVCDVITVHCPLNDSTRGWIGKDIINKMKDGVYLINYARGPILDNDAVCDALDSGKITSFATDFPTPRQMERSDIVFTPHLAAGTPEADENCSIMAARQTIDYIENGNITNSVNFPNVAFARAGGARVCIMHDNKIGMLGKMTDIAVGHGLNIENLINKANGEIAYTIMDFKTSVPDKLVDDINSIDGIIRVRVIN